MNTKVTTLSNGLRVASCSLPSSQTVAVGLWCGVGSRYEPARIGGASHFLEHLLFKGTRKRTARQISEEIEGVGGDLNAFTAEERTCYHAAASQDHFSRIAEVLSDMYCHSLLDPAEVERERGVIGEEIEMVRDEPCQHAHELLSGEMWKGHPLGRPITGSKKTLAAITRKDLIGHLRSHYHAGRTIFTAAGAVDHGDAVELAGRFLGKLHNGSSLPRQTVPPSCSSPRILIDPRESQQTQLVLSFRGVGAADPRRFAVNLLHVIFGGNMSSRLFQELRERRGLCYSINSSFSTYSDCGSFEISLGLDGANVCKALKLILGECRKLVEKGPSRTELRRACDYSIGTSRMALERAATQNYRLGVSLLSYGRIVPPEDVYKRLANVPISKVQAVAGQTFQNRRLSLVMVGPGPSREEIQSIIQSMR